MLQRLADSQDAYQTQLAVSGPFAPVYCLETWDGTQYGTGWTWNGPDPNTFWGGYQYRAFAAVADYWQRVVTLGGTSSAAAGIANRFLTWLDNWLTANPSVPGIPDTFSSSAAPSYTYPEPHMIAVAVKGAVWCGRAGADIATSRRVRLRLLSRLDGLRVTSGANTGWYDQNNVYGFWAGELLDAYAVAATSGTI
jgi:hypothetical protein